MEYQDLTPADKNYPKRLFERLGDAAPKELYYWGPLDFLNRYTMGVISADSINGLALMATNQLLFTIREYDLNYIGGWHSVIDLPPFFVPPGMLQKLWFSEYWDGGVRSRDSRHSLKSRRL